ncbi:hypothetical protein ACROYT_G022529 [Oculina patagonica]
MSCSTPVNPFKSGNPFTPTSDLSLDRSVNLESSSRRVHSANPFASENQLNNSGTYSSNPFASSESEPSNNSADLFTNRRKFSKPVKNPADYDGTQSLRDYLKHFERCSVVNGWNEDEAAVFLAASLRGEAQKVLNGMSDSDCRNYAKIVDKLELRFGVEKQRELHQARLHNRRQQENESVQALAADIRSMSSLAYQDLSPDTQERFAVQHFIDAIKDQDDRLRLRRDKPKTMDEALTLACELEAFRLLDGDWRGSSSKDRSVDEVGKEPDLLRAQLDMLRSDIQMQQQRQETQQVALQELVQQIQQLSQTMTLNTSGSPNAPRYPNRNGQCWYCKEFGHYRRNCPKSKSHDRIFDSLPDSVKFSLSSVHSAITLADGQQAKTHGVGHVVVHLGTKEFQMCVIVADIEDEGILGMDFLSQVDSQIDIVKNQVSINGEVFDCSDFKNQPLSSRCMVRRSTIIEPHTEVVVPVTVHKRSATLNPKASQVGM